MPPTSPTTRRPTTPSSTARVDAALGGKCVRPQAIGPHEPLVSVLLAMLEKFPETLAITAGVDPLRYEGEAFAEKLAKNGVRFGIVRVRETVHGFVLWNALADTPPTLTAIDLAAATIKPVLN